jgi:cytochrome c peroxidase
MEVFTGDAACAACHSGAETTDNSVRILLGTTVDGVKQPAEVVERMFNGNCEVVAYDQGVYNLGVRPFEEDIGIGGKDHSAIARVHQPADVAPAVDTDKELLTLSIPNIANPPISAADRALTTGAFKVPICATGLTAPCPNGGQATIRQAVEFYNAVATFVNTTPRLSFESASSI